MESVKLVLSEEKKLLFSGERLFHSRSEDCVVGSETRWFELSGFAREEGGFVPVICFHSKGEPPVTIAERVDEYKDIENFFFVFEPSEMLDRKPFMALSTKQRLRIEKGLMGIYDTEVNKALLATRAFVGEQTRKRTSKQKERKRLFGFFR